MLRSTMIAIAPLVSVQSAALAQNTTQGGEALCIEPVKDLRCIDDLFQPTPKKLRQKHDSVLYVPLPGLRIVNTK